MYFLVGTSASSASKSGLLFQMLLVTVFCVLAAASSIIDTAGLPADSETIESYANTSSVAENLEILQAHADTKLRPNVVFQETCSDDQVTYLHTSMSEAADLASRAHTAVLELLEIMQNKEQPSTWSAAQYTRRSRNFLLWNSFFGQMDLGKANGKVTQKNAIYTMKQARSIFNIVKNTLSASNQEFQNIINCGDDWLVNTHTMGEDGLDIYHDTRVKDRRFVFAHKTTCHESTAVRGYLFHPETSPDQETVFCPNSFNSLWRGNTLASIQSSSYESLKGKTMKYLKEYAAASTVFHELTHSKKSLGDWYTEDLKVTYKGKKYGAYGSLLVRELGKVFNEETGEPIENADTLTLFALGVYFNQCNWANSETPGKCSGDLPDPICPRDKNGRRNCVRFF